MYNEECPCCLESKETTALSCNHFCCEICIKQIIKIEPKCPLCRRTFDITPFKYQAPKHKPNLKISLKQIKCLNTFLKCRYFLTPCKKQRLYGNLLHKYTDQIVFQNKYLHLNSLLLDEIKYDVDYLIDCLIWLHTHPKSYSYAIRQDVIYSIRSALISILM